MEFVSLERNFSNGTPARVHRPTGTVYLTPKFYEMYTPTQQRFIILHELGHYVNQTTDESEADRFAADILLNLEGYKATFRALNDSLHSGAVNDTRRENLFNYLKERDMKGLENNAVIDGKKEYRRVNYESFEDANGCMFTNDYIGEGEIDELEIADYLNFCDFYGLEYSDMSKGEYRQQKRDAKIAAKKAKADAKQSRADARRIKANAKMEKAKAKMELAKQGISSGAEFAKGLSGIGSKIAGIFGKGGDDTEVSDGGTYAESESGSSSKLPLILGGVAAVVVVAIIIIVVLKKKKK
jgi:hypothetical protein